MPIPSRVVFGFYDGLQHLAPGDAEQIGRHRGNLDVARLAQLLNPVLGPVQIFEEIHSLPCQIAQFADLTLRNPTAL
jgi:hypothetical protein